MQGHAGGQQWSLRWDRRQAAAEGSLGMPGL